MSVMERAYSPLRLLASWAAEMPLSMVLVVPKTLSRVDDQVKELRKVKPWLVVFSRRAMKEL